MHKRYKYSIIHKILGELMALNLEQASYHLGYEVDGDQPVISVHTDLANFAGLQEEEEGLARYQSYLGIDSPFSFDVDRFGYEGLGSIEESTRVEDWTVLRLALPEPETSESYYGATTPRVLPVVTTLSVVLSRLNHSAEGATDPENPQLLTASLSNNVPLNSHYSAPLRAVITFDGLDRLSAVSDMEAAEEQVRQALFESFQYPYGHREEDDFRVSLGDNISFDYPGDGTGFFASRSQGLKREGLVLNAANNDYPIQQLGIIGGLAALNDILLDAAAA